MTRKALLICLLTIAPGISLAQIEQEDLAMNTETSFNLADNEMQTKENPAPDCEGIVHQIHNDIAAWPASSANQYLPWMQVAWVKSNLGQPQSANVRDLVYVWKNFSLFVGADGSLEKIGTLPNQIQAKSLEDVTKLMGQPKKIFSEQLTLHQWICPTNTHTWIAMLTKQDNSSIGIMGSDCKANGPCETFFSAYADSEIKHKFKQQMIEQAEVSMNQLSLRLKSYNEFFKTSLQNQSQLSDDVSARIKTYYSSLRECKKGIYQYVTPVLQDYLYQTSTISKQENNLCFVDTTYRIPNIGKISLKCQFSAQTLGLFSDTEAESAARGFVKIDSNLQKMISSECKRYIGGVL